MRIEYAIPCKYAEVNDGLATIVGAGIDTTTAPEFPMGVQFMLAVRVLATAEELPGAHQIRCGVRNGSGEHVADVMEAQLELPPEPVGPHPGGDDWLHNIMLAVGVAFEAAEADTYTVDVLFDDAEYPVVVYVVGADS